MRLFMCFFILISYSALGQRKDSVLYCRYPSAARKAGIQGSVEIKLTLRSNCSVMSYRVTQRLGYGCDEAAVECLLLRFEKSQRRYLCGWEGDCSLREVQFS